MKRLLTLVALLAFLPLWAQNYRNPILHMDYSDPDVCRVGEDYYMTASSFNCFPGLPVLHSRDLVNWEPVGAALTAYDPLFRETVQHGNGVWAPAIRYHDGWFYIFCGDPDRGIFMVRAQNPAGPWENPVWLVREKGFIDPCPFWDQEPAWKGLPALFLTVILPSRPLREPSFTSGMGSIISLHPPAVWRQAGRRFSGLTAHGDLLNSGLCWPGRGEP